MIRLIIAILLFAVMWLAPCTSAVADDEVEDKWSLSLGVFIADQDVETRFVGNGTLGNSVRLNLEDTLGLKPNKTVARLDGAYRFRERQRLDFTIFDLSRSATASISEEIIWQDSVFPVSAEVKSRIDFTIYKVAYVYDLHRTEKADFGLSAGLHIADVGVDLRATGLNLREQADVAAPLPVFGARGNYRFGENWFLHGHYEWFALEIDDIEGQISDLLVSLNYELGDNFALGVGYNITTLDVDALEDHFKGDLSWDYSGALLFAAVRF